MLDKIDVCVCTKLETLPDWWFENVRRLPTNQVIVERSEPLGYARMRAIQRVQTSFFVFIDDDVLIGKEWLQEILKYLRPNVAAVSGREQLIGLGKDWETNLNGFRWSKGNRELQVGERGTTLNTLIRTRLVKDWKPSRQDLSSWEDYELVQHILKEGYKWLEVNVHCKHFSYRWLDIINKAFWHMEGLKKIDPSPQFYRPNYMKRLLVAIPIFYIRGFLRAHDRKNPKTKYSLRLATFIAWQNFWLIIGLLIK